MTLVLMCPLVASLGCRRQEPEFPLFSQSWGGGSLSSNHDPSQEIANIVVLLALSSYLNLSNHIYSRCLLGSC